MKLTGFLVCFLVAVMTLSADAQEESNLSVVDRAITLKLENQEFSRFTNFLTRDLKIPIGFEESLLDAGHRDYEFEPNLPFIRKDVDSRGKTVLVTGLERVPSATEHLISVDVTNRKLSEVMDIVVGQMQNYSWSYENGVIRIIPTKGRDPITEALLKVPIPEVSVEKEVLICDLRLELPGLPEIAKFLNDHKLRTKTLFLAGNCYRAIGEDISLKNVTFEGLLNEIVRKKGGAWAVRYKKLGKSGYDPNTLDLVL